MSLIVFVAHSPASPHDRKTGPSLLVHPHSHAPTLLITASQRRPQFCGLEQVSPHHLRILSFLGTVSSDCARKKKEENLQSNPSPARAPTPRQPAPGYTAEESVEHTFSSLSAIHSFYRPSRR